MSKITVKYISENLGEFKKYRIIISGLLHEFTFYALFSLHYEITSGYLKWKEIETFLEEIFTEFETEFEKMPRESQEKFFWQESYTIGFWEERDCDYTFSNHQGPVKISNFLQISTF